MGLLDFDSMSPNDIGTLQLGLGLLGSHGNFAHAISQGGEQALQGYQQAKKDQLDRQMQQMQLALTQYKMQLPGVIAPDETPAAPYQKALGAIPPGSGPLASVSDAVTTQNATGATSKSAIPGLPNAKFRALMQLDPGKAIEGYLAQYKPDPIRASILAAGVDPDSPQGQKMALASYEKGVYIAPNEIKAGNLATDPRTNQPIAYNPRVQDGIGVDFSNPMRPTTYGLPGYAPAAANLVGATTRAIQGNTIETNIPGPDGRPLSGFGFDLFGGNGGQSAPVSGQPVPVAGQSTVPGFSPRVVAGQSPQDTKLASDNAGILGGLPAQQIQIRQTKSGLDKAIAKIQELPNTGPGVSSQTNSVALLNNILGTHYKEGEIDARKELSKFLQNALSISSAATGANGSDARMEQFTHGMPNDEAMTKGSLLNAAKYVASQMDAADAATGYVQKRAVELAKQGDPQAIQHARQEFSTQYNPQVFEFNRMSPAERKVFKQTLANDPVQFKAFSDAYNSAHTKGWVQ